MTTLLKNNINFVVRDTITVSRAELSQDFLNPENIRLQLNKATRTSPYDLGALAFSRRKHQKSHQTYLPMWVDLASFRLERRKLLRCLQEYICLSGNTDNTVGTHITVFFTIIDWLDSNGHSSTFESVASTRLAYCAYVDQLNHQIKRADTHTIGPKVANFRQRSFSKLIKLFWGNEAGLEIVREVPIIKPVSPESEAPAEANIRMAVSTFLHLARGFSAFVIEQRHFPYLLKMPGYSSYIFPCNRFPCITPFSTTQNATYNYENGEFSTPEEYLEKCNREIPLSEARAELKKSRKKLAKTNSNQFNYSRMIYASLAMRSYMQLFIMMTGINSSELMQLEYSESYELDKDLIDNNFRAIKLRAKGKVVSYHLGNHTGLAIFKEYIALRNWVLGSEYSPYLFFSFVCSKQRIKSFHPLSKNNIYGIYSSVKGKFLPKSFEHITAGKIRKYKTLIWNELELSQDVIARSLNHSKFTNHKSYAVSNFDKQQKELGEFFESAHAAANVFVNKASSMSQENTSTGHCEDFWSPKPILSEQSIEPDCSNSMGCLFCEHYMCHADESDIHKLCSLLYVAEEIRRTAADFEHSDSLLKELVIRIKEVLRLLADRSELTRELIGKVKSKVFDEGELTIFWEMKLQRLEAMGVIFSG